MKVLMCSPAFYDIYYEINPWMNKAHGANRALAQRQWQQLKQLIHQCGADIVLIPQVHGLPDMVFTANAGLVYKNKIFLSRFKFPERQGEYPYFKAWFQQHHYEIITEPKVDFVAEKIPSAAVMHYRGPTFEGEGDDLFLGDVLFVGYGFRSHKDYFKLLAEVGIKNIVYCELVDPYFYHLDTCFCPLDEKQALWWPAAFSKESQLAMQKKAELFAVPEAEAKRFACNAVVLGKNIIIPSDCPETRKILEQLKFTVYSCDMSEYIKAGGACKCLTLFI